MDPRADMIHARERRTDRITRIESPVEGDLRGAKCGGLYPKSQVVTDDGAVTCDRCREASVKEALHTLQKAVEL